jgi:phosphatidyl-myo-inositol dimannoside synthase
MKSPGSRKILMITRNFPPLVGGMERLNFNIYLALKKRYNTLLAGPYGSSNFHNQVCFVEFPIKPLWLFIISSLIKTCVFSSRLKPQLILCGSGTSILAGYIASRLCSAKLVCYLHGLDIVASNFIYQSVFVPLIKKSDLLIVNSKHTQGLAIEAGVNTKRIYLLSPGVSIPALSTKQELIQGFRSRYNLNNRRFLLLAGRITARKGIVEFIEQVFVNVLVKMPDLVLVIVGEEARDAAKASQGVTDAIYKVILKHNLQEKVVLTGGVNEREYSAALFAADIFVFPALNLPNDVEGFGMVAIEAAAHGLPTVAFAVGGVPDAVADGISGWLVSSGNYLEMANKIVSYLSGRELTNVTSMSCRSFAEDFEWSKFEEKLHLIIDGLSDGS